MNRFNQSARYTLYSAKNWTIVKFLRLNDPEFQIIKKRFLVFYALVIIAACVLILLIVTSCKGYFIHMHSNVRVGSTKDSVVIAPLPLNTKDSIPVQH